MASRETRRPPDGEIAANAVFPAIPEFRRHPPEFAAPGGGSANDPRMEFTAPPAEYPVGLTTAEEAPRDRSRFWRKLLAAALVGIVGWSAFGAIQQKNVSAPAGEGDQSGSVVSQADDGLALTIGYALTDGETIYYSYFVDVPDNDEPDEDSPYWPVDVYSSAEDESGNVVAAEDDPDTWEYARASQFDYRLPATGLSGGITLRLKAEYELDGEKRTLTATREVGQMPPAESFAFLYVQDDGTAEFKAAFTTAEDDEHVYDLEPMMLWAEAFDASQQRVGGFWSLQDLSALAYDSFEESGRKEYVLHCMETIDGWPENAKYCSFRCYVRDKTNGYIYQLESNLAKLPAETYPLGDETIEITVYNDTLTYEYASLVDDPGWVTILAKTQLSAADFTEYELPLPMVPAGYRGTGYVVFFGSPFDNGYDAYEDYGGPLNEVPDVTENFTGEAPVEAYISKAMFAFPVNGLTLTKAMVERVPIAEDGVRYVNVHATWAVDTGDADFYVELDDGEGNVTLYPVAHPLASEGFFFTVTFPQPSPPKGDFDGWYDESGKRVDYLMDYYSFVPYLYDENGKYVDYNWSGTPKTVHLIARWLPY